MRRNTVVPGELVIDNDPDRAETPSSRCHVNKDADTGLSQERGGTPRFNRKNNNNSTCSREGIEMVLPQDVTTVRGADAASTTDSWDPYDVWLTRVKQPRDRVPQRATLVVEVRSDIKTTEPKPSGSLHLRAT